MKLTTHSVNSVVIQKGYEVDPEFQWVNSKIPVTFFCKKHGKVSMLFSNLKRSECKQCSVEKVALKKIQENNTLQKFKDLAKQRNFEIINHPKEMQGTSKVLLKCQKDGYEWETSYSVLRTKKHGCSRCSNLEPLNYQEMADKIVEKGFAILSEEPERFNQKFRFTLRCPEGHVGEVSAMSIRKGLKCKYCGGTYLTEDQVTDRLKDRGFSTKTSYDNVRGNLQLQCEKGHEITKSYFSIYHDGTKCPQCDPPYTSKGEDEVAAWLRGIISDKEILRNDRELLKGNELDIYIPSRKIAIEYCGLYFHTEEFLIGSGKSPLNAQKYHQSKALRAMNVGVQLITMWDYEWIQRRQAVQTRLKSLLGLNSRRYGARKLELKEIFQKEVVKEFLDTYHIQKSASFQYAWGLYLGDELLSVMTFQKHHRQNVSKNTLVLNRFCVKEDVTIAGGASKLFQHAYKVLNVPILSYSDNRWSTGEIYEKLDFKKIKVSRPDYFYVKNGRGPYSKQSLKKTNEEKYSGKTEYELRTEQGYQRVWDCGKITWIYE